MGYASEQCIKQMTRHISDEEWAEYERICQEESHQEERFWRGQAPANPTAARMFTFSLWLAGFNAYQERKHGEFYQYAAQEWKDGYDAAQEAEVEALFAEVFGKPRLGVQDSAGLIDYGAELADLRDGMDDDLFNRWGC